MWEWSLLSCPILCMQDRAQKAFQPPNLLETLSCQVRYARPWRHLNLLCLHLHDCIFNIIHLSLSLLPSTPPPPPKKKHHIICMCNNIHKVYITYHASGLIKMGRDNERKQGEEVEVMVKRALQD